MTLERGLEMEGSLGVAMLVFLFAMWFTLTLAILITMEGLSAFLHALRLHWVEFNGKFYGGAGTVSFCLALADGPLEWGDAARD